MPVRPRARRSRSSERPRPSEPALVLAGRGFLRGRIQPIEVAIDPEGFISAVGRDLRGPRRHDVGDRLILPAAIDLHVHFRHPEDARGVESFATGTVQAALAGVGLAGEMPNSEPPATTAERLEERRDRGRGRLAVDLLLYGALTTPHRVDELSRVAGAFKLYMAPTTQTEAATDRTGSSLAERLAAVAATGLPLSVHAEDPGAFDRSIVPTDTLEWNRARPPAAELAAVDRLLAEAPPGLRLHVAHVTLPESANRLRAAGQSFESTAHHLFLAARPGVGSRMKVNPPLRSEADRAGLLESFARGEVPVLASDHAPHSIEEKERPFALAPSGMPGVLTTLPILLAQVRRGRIDLPTLWSAASDRPARWFGVPMGRIEPGHRADLVVVDPTVRTEVRTDPAITPCGWSPFEGWEAIFPREHYHDGERIVEGGEYVGRPTGRFVRPEFAPLPARTRIVSKLPEETGTGRAGSLHGPRGEG